MDQTKDDWVRTHSNVFGTKTQSDHCDLIPMRGRATSVRVAVDDKVVKKINFHSFWRHVDPKSSCENEVNGKFEGTKSLGNRLRNLTACPTSRVLLTRAPLTLGHFRSLQDVVRVLLDVVRGHKYLYERGVLHCDVSADNIMVAWCEGEDYLGNAVAKGSLIECHSAQYGKDMPVHDVPANFPTMNRGSAERKASFFHDVAEDDDISPQTIVNADVMLAGSEAVRRICLDAYVLDVWKHISRFSAVNVGQCHAIDSALLKWTKVSRKFSFKFTDEERQLGIGTLPYTSGEILSRDRYYSLNCAASKDLFHDAVHDIESVFWVLIHICLTRSGPGVQQREELAGDSKEHEQLRSVMYRLFDADWRVLATNKRQLFRYRGDLEDSIFQSFHPYFDELKPFMKEWFSLLALAYEYVEGYEYHNIHSRAQDILERALESVTPGTMDFELSQKEENSIR